MQRSVNAEAQRVIARCRPNLLCKGDCMAFILLELGCLCNYASIYFIKAIKPWRPLLGGGGGPTTAGPDVADTRLASCGPPHPLTKALFTGP